MKTNTNNSRNFRVTAATICSILAGFSAGAADDVRWQFDGDLSTRAAAVAEGLAVRETSGFVADPDMTNAFSDDLEAIYAIYPGLAAATPFPESPNTIIVDVDPEVSQESILSALPAEAGFESYVPSFHTWIALNFAETINAAHLAEWVVSNVAGVRAAQPDYLGGDGNDVIYHVNEDLYAFKIGEGDCWSGCIDEFWRFVLMSADGPVEIGSDELEVVFSGELNTAISPTLTVVPGDWLSVANLALGQDVMIVRENAFGREELEDAYIDFGSASSVGTYEISVERPYGLAPIVHSITVDLRESGSLFGGERFLNGWVNDPDFGWAFDQDANWIFHAAHGWLYLANNSASSAQAWAYDSKAGWLSLDRNSYPWVYSADHGWMYYQTGTEAPRYFYMPDSASWWAVK